MKKKNRIRFSGKGPFSSINLLTTEIRTIEAVKRYGLGGDAAHQAIDESNDPEFVDGILNYHKIAEDPDYGRKK